MSGIIEVVKSDYDRLDKINKDIKELNQEQVSVRNEIIQYTIPLTKELLSKLGDDLYFYNPYSNIFYHCGSFEYLSWCGIVDAVKKPHYANDYEANFKVKEAFYNSISSISYHNSITANESFLRTELDTSFKNQFVDYPIFKYIKLISKEDYEKYKTNIEKKKLNAESREITDINGKKLKQGTKVNYTKSSSKKVLGGIVSMVVKDIVYIKGEFKGFNATKGNIVAV